MVQLKGNPFLGLEFFKSVSACRMPQLKHLYRRPTSNVTKATGVQPSEFFEFSQSILGSMIRVPCQAPPLSSSKELN